MTPPLLIDQSDALEAFVARALDAPWLGLDTEFVRDRTYFPRAGLIQIATPRETALVDPVRLEDLAPLETLLCETDAVKILHAAYQDLELIQHLFARVPMPLFDTQMAASLVGSTPQIGYATLVDELLHEDVQASLGRYDWLARPLAAPAVAYAADDVAHLGALHELLSERLETAGKSGGFAALMREWADPERYRPHPDEAWRRIRAARRLDPAARERLKSLARWRERQAMAEDRPRQWIVRDQALVLLARRAPRSAPELADIRLLGPAMRRRYGEALLAVIQSPCDSPSAASSAAGGSLRSSSASPG